MSKRNPSKLSSFFNSQAYTEALPNIEDFLEVPMTIKGVSWRQGQFGEFCVVVADILETGMELRFQTGAVAVRDCMHEAEHKRMFPFDCKFIKANRAIVPAEVD